jgi:catechol 2,3-dioxygenase-like lactoylglutathione lyase family enzyme
MPEAGTDIFHVGILVADLDDAIEKYSNAIGLTFGPKQSRCLSVAAAGGTHDSDLELVYSLEGPPYVELMQAQPDAGVWGAHRGEGMHHIGAWVDDLDARIAELASAGVRVEAALSLAEKLIAVYLEPDDLTGTRLELCARPAGPWAPPR